VTLNPLSFKLLLRLEPVLQRAPALWRHMHKRAAARELDTSVFNKHVVVVGYGRVGEHVINVLGHLGVQRLVVEIDAGKAADFEKRGIPTLYGDAANSEILLHAGLERARALVVTLPNETAAEIVVATAHKIAPKLPIIARAATSAGLGRLARRGARM
jgi:monovalent cation:H+ antiporter-2, CPA2 family